MRGDDLRDRALSMWEDSEERLTTFESRARAFPLDSSYVLDVIVEGARNSTLRELLGKDNRDDELRAARESDG